MAFYDPLLGGSASDYCVPWERRLETHRFGIEFKFPFFAKIVSDFFFLRGGGVCTQGREWKLCFALCPVRFFAAVVRWWVNAFQGVKY